MSDRPDDRVIVLPRPVQGCSSTIPCGKRMDEQWQNGGDAHGLAYSKLSGGCSGSFPVAASTILRPRFGLQPGGPLPVSHQRARLPGGGHRMRAARKIG